MRLVVICAVALSSCAMLKPSISIGLSRISDDYQLNQNDTTKAVLDVDSKINFDFDLRGSKRISIHPGFSRFLADGVSPGWFYIDVIGTSTWVRGLPVYLSGGDTVSLDIDDNYLDVDGRPFFMVEQDKSMQFSFVPELSLRCVGCTRAPILRFDGKQVKNVPPENSRFSRQTWISVNAGWHTIETYSPLDNVNLYYRTLFDNYTITELTLYPILMN